MKQPNIGMRVACRGGSKFQIILGTYMGRVDPMFRSYYSNNRIHWDDGVATQCSDKELDGLRSLYVKHNTKLGKILYK